MGNLDLTKWAIWISISSFPQPSGKLSLNTPGRPSKSRVWEVCNPDFNGSRKGDRARPRRIKSASYSNIFIDPEGLDPPQA